MMMAITNHHKQSRSTTWPKYLMASLQPTLWSFKNQWDIFDQIPCYFYVYFDSPVHRGMLNAIKKDIWKEKAAIERRMS